MKWIIGHLKSEARKSFVEDTSQLRNTRVTDFKTNGEVIN
jgi:hypothetical protein